MRLLSFQSRFMLVFLIAIIEPCLLAQPPQDRKNPSRREKALELFKQGKRLEALPLLEELVRDNAKDDEMLVALAACLVEHAATLTDEAVAGKERLRARDLLDKAWELGNTSPLALNLSQLLKQLPENGAIKFSDNPQVERFMRAGEAAFSSRDFDRALAEYSQALNLDPSSYSATLFIANTYDRKNDLAKGAEWYERAIRLDANVETAYRYYADMMAREGDMSKARTLLIEAAVAEPYNRTVWRELHAWASLNDTHLNQIYIGIPSPAKDTPIGHQATSGPSAVWQEYYARRADWQRGREFQNRFPGEKEYRHSLPEEAEALTAAAKVLEKLQKEEKTAERLANDEALNLLSKLYRAELIEPYVAFSLADSGIARDYLSYRANHRQKLTEYMDRFVVPPSARTQN